MSRSRVITRVQGGSRIRPTRVEVDLPAICRNAARLRRLAGPVCAVVKADAYGHGAARVATALEASGYVSGLAVSLVEEAAELRRAGVGLPILVMGPALGDAHAETLALEVTPMVSDPDDLEAFAALGRRRERPVEVHLKIDTGMSRLGLAPSAIPALLERAGSRGDVVVTGVATHLACADIDDPSAVDSMTRLQLDRLRAIAESARAEAGSSVRVHAANSSAALRFPESRWDFIRPGLALYGGGPAAAESGLEPTTRLVSEVSQIREVSEGASVSYNALWRARRHTRAAVLPIGYADGFPRALTRGGEVLIGGRRCPVVGAVSMDIAIADVTDLGDEVAVGDEAVLLGTQGDEHLSIGEFAERAGLIEHEVICGFSKRVPRAYL